MQYFEDFNDEALGRILIRKLKQEHVSCPLDVRHEAVKLLAKQRAMKNFGNAGALDGMISEALKRANFRMKEAHETGPICLSREDFNLPDKNADPFEDLRQLCKMDGIIKKLQGLLDADESARLRGTAPPPPSHYVFLGNAGTGKTTVAEAMAKILYRMGRLPSEKCVVVQALDLFGSAVGQAAEIVEAKMEEALGGILLIDEAYELGKMGYGEQAQTKLLGNMTMDEYKDGKIVIILAGYKNEMENMWP